MTFEELLAKANAETTRAKPRHEESQLQRICVKWFRLQYPELAILLFAVPNGGYASLCMEFKTEKGRQQETQKLWQQAAERAGNKYAIIRSFDDFRTEVKNYLPPPYKRNT